MNTTRNAELSVNYVHLILFALYEHTGKFVLGSQRDYIRVDHSMQLQFIFLKTTSKGVNQPYLLFPVFSCVQFCWRWRWSTGPFWIQSLSSPSFWVRSHLVIYFLTHISTMLWYYLAQNIDTAEIFMRCKNFGSCDIMRYQLRLNINATRSIHALRARAESKLIYIAYHNMISRTSWISRILRFFSTR